MDRLTKTRKWAEPVKKQILLSYFSISLIALMYSTLKICKITFGYGQNSLPYLQMENAPKPNSGFLTDSSLYLRY